MIVFHRESDLAGFQDRTSVALGNFDGLHLGHRALLKSSLEKAKALGLAPSVLTFFPHPLEVLRPEHKTPRLMTTQEKLKGFEDLGFSYAWVVAFDKQLSSLSPDGFFDRFLVQGFRAEALQVGFNFHFGKGRAGNPETLKGLCTKHRVDLYVEPPFAYHGERVHSTGIREKIASGDVEGACRWLGRPYSMVGTVVPGQAKGRGLGFSTANLRIPKEKAVPGSGVYATESVWQGQSFVSVTNIGTRPTFYPETDEVVVETHLIDFKADLYDETLELRFLKRLRDEKRFSNVDELKKQIALDVEATQALFRGKLCTIPSTL